MSSTDCIFCSLISGKIPAEIILETDDIMVVKDRYPKAPVHYLIIPKEHIENVMGLKEEHALLSHNVMQMVQRLALTLDEPHAFNLIVNNGASAGQSVMHLHLHFLSGKNIYQSGLSL